METKILLPAPPLVLPESRKGQKRVYVLGADDPEMEEIVRMLQAVGKEYVFATFNGERVNPATAYTADPVGCPDGMTLVFVECHPKELCPGAYYTEYVDHHNKGDIGYNLPPEKYMFGSSLCQIAALEGVLLTERQLIIAALDHCAAYAMRGFCPGVDPELAKRLYHEGTARRKNVPIEDVYACMQEVGKDMAIAPSTRVGDTPVVDMTMISTGTGYSLRYISTIATAVNVGIPVLLSNRNSPGAPEKHVLTGFIPSPDLVQAFFDDYATRYPLTGLWGDHNRGAGGFVSR